MVCSFMLSRCGSYLSRNKILGINNSQGRKVWVNAWCYQMIQLMVYWHDFGPVVIQNMMERVEEACSSLHYLVVRKENKNKINPIKLKKKSLNFTMPQFLKVFTTQYVNELGRSSVSRVLTLS